MLSVPRNAPSHDGQGMLCVPRDVPDGQGMLCVPRDVPPGTPREGQGMLSVPRNASPGMLRPTTGRGCCVSPGMLCPQECSVPRRAGNFVCPQGRCVSGTLLQGRTGRVCCVSPGTPGTCAGNVVCPQGRCASREFCVSPGTVCVPRDEISRQQNRPSTKRSCELFVLRPIGACSGENSRNTTRHRAVNDWPSTIPV
jgi:hypothetical protein